ncbi:hypothetical protein NKH18_19530 [Streptomyces sp. M10(2022)]
MSIAVLASHNGYANIDEDLRARMLAISEGRRSTTAASTTRRRLRRSRARASRQAQSRRSRTRATPRVSAGSEDDDHWCGTGTDGGTGMDHKEAGQGTPFDGMSHEEMLAWLDASNSGAIQGASDRLVSAAKEIRKIAEELKVRPQTVEWKGDGADAFRTWSADLANATLRLGAYSEGASKWLAQASDSLATAQAAIPRTHAGRRRIWMRRGRRGTTRMRPRSRRRRRKR